MKNFIFLISVLLLTACTGGSFGNTNNSNINQAEPTSENSTEQQQPSYNPNNSNYPGYEDVTEPNNYITEDSFYIYHNDNGEVWISRSQEEEDEYQMMKEREALYEEMERQRDFYNWESEDVDALYVYLDGVDDDDVAEYMANEYYEGEYIQESWKYFAKVSHTWGKYKITLGEQVSSYLYNVSGSDIYIHFTWLPDVSSGDEGVLDWSGTYSTFYKKP